MTIVPDVLDRRYPEFMAEESSDVQDEMEGEEGEGSTGAAKDEKKVGIDLRGASSIHNEAKLTIR